MIPKKKKKKNYNNERSPQSQLSSAYRGESVAK